jgi:hypothetical protein
VRIILRTGQPGQAPERRVIVDYDINDYKAKTELTADKLFTSLTASLRSYQQLQRMVETRRGLEMIIEGAATLYDLKSMQKLAEGVLTQIASLLNVECGGILVLREGAPRERFSILAGSGCYRHFAGLAGAEKLDPILRQAVQSAFERRAHEFEPKLSVLYLRTATAREVVVVLETSRTLTPTDRSLVEVFCSRLSVAFDNVILYEQLHEANIRLEERVRDRTHALTTANDRLSAQWTRLRRANEFKNEVLGTVAHDLKNPLGVISGAPRCSTSSPPWSRCRSTGSRISSATSALGPATDRNGQRADLGRHDGYARHRDPQRADRSCRHAGGIVVPTGHWPRRSSRTFISVAAAPDLELRSGPVARGGRQSPEQRHQVQSERRQESSC